MDLDLVEVAPEARPPVCRVMDYRKYRYEAQQRAKESRRKSTNIVVKEMKYRPKISDGDFWTKTRKVIGFLEEGHKVKITIMFRGREVQHPELGMRILNRIADEVKNLAKVEASPRQDGRNMTMVLGPDKRAQAAWAAEQKKQAELDQQDADAAAVKAAGGSEAEATIAVPEAATEATAAEPTSDTVTDTDAIDAAATEAPAEAADVEVAETSDAAEAPAEETAAE